MDRPGYLPSHLTEQQLEAILARGSPLLIIAGPGSGKTEVITWRVAHLLASGQADPAHCLVTTFTNQEIARYEGRHDDPIYQAPALYRLLTQLLDDNRLPGRLRPLVACAVAYFILPADIIFEDIHGPYGYADDICLCTWVADILNSRSLYESAYLAEAKLKEWETRLSERLPAITLLVELDLSQANCESCSSTVASSVKASPIDVPSTSTRRP